MSETKITHAGHDYEATLPREDEADALIAAPTLYEALEALVEAVDRSNWRQVPARIAHAADDGRRALAQARGEEI